MTGKEAIKELRQYNSVGLCGDKTLFEPIEKELNILQEIRCEYIVFRDGDDYFLRGGKSLYLITRKQYDNWMRWLDDKS